MEIRCSGYFLLIALAACALAGCASAPLADGTKPASEVNLYKMNNLSGTSYEIVSRIWVGSWRSAFYTPTYPSEDEAIQSLRTEAARLGANGLADVVCLDQGRTRLFQNPGPVILCYANAIRVRPAQS